MQTKLSPTRITKLFMTNNDQYSGFFFKFLELRNINGEKLLRVLFKYFFLHFKGYIL